MSNQKLLKHALVQSNMFNMFEQLLQLQKIIKKICFVCNQLSKLLDMLFKKLSKKYCPLCNISHVHYAILLDNLPKNVVQAMSTVQYQPCPLCKILSDNLPKTVVQAMSTAIYYQTNCQKMLSFILQNQYQPEKMSTKSSYILNLNKYEKISL